MSNKKFMAFIVSTTLLFVCAFGTLNFGGEGRGYSFNRRQKRN